jgi:long-chain acyl-CoA synthetase
MTLTFPEIIGKSLKQYAANNAASFVGGEAFSYQEVDNNIKALTELLSAEGIEKGDKVAILCANNPQWGIAYFAITFMGAIVVPLLPDFTVSEVENIMNHSEAKAIFISENQINKVEKLQNDFVTSIIKIDDFSFIKENKKKNLSGFSIPDIDEQDIAAIIYTSGTTGKSKGVMLTHKNILSNAISGRNLQPIEEDDRFLSILPLSHTLENTLGLILPYMCGASIHYLQKPPTAAVLLPAMKLVRPTIMLTVPMIIEKVYRNKVKPEFDKSGVIRTLYKVPFVRKKLHQVAGKKLMQTFGGALKFYGVGGAKLDGTVERFLNEAKFPYAIGYGLTETSPLLAGATPGKTSVGSTGPAIQSVEVRIENANPKTGEGEIVARGPNIMKGYYKDPEATANVLSEDGWFRTGDLGYIDNSNYLHIRGRIKNVIVKSTGENIYPEEIESVINNFKHVVESLVLEKKGKLVAMVHFNKTELEDKYLHLKEEVSDYVDHVIEELAKELQTWANERLNKFSQVQVVLYQPIPFEKTATQKIKRFLYY